MRAIRSYTEKSVANKDKMGVKMKIDTSDPRRTISLPPISKVPAFLVLIAVVSCIVALPNRARAQTDQTI
jgi:hypothetical protein